MANMVNISDEQRIAYEVLIEGYNKKFDWNDIKNIHYHYYGGDFDAFMDNLTLVPTSGINTKLTLEEWHSLIDDISKESKVAEPRLLSDNELNDLKKSSEKHSQWQQYKNHLIVNSKFSKFSINNIENEAYYILRNLSIDTINREKGPVKGLVVGDVQSGKTANMAGLISMAADNGFNYFIILSGTIESLRLQTRNRMRKDLAGNTIYSKFNWKELEKPSLGDNNPDLQWENINLNSRDRFYTISLKNKVLLTKLRNWLYSDERKLKDLKILVIDDEADQASINTKDVDTEERTAINNLIKELVHGFEGKKVRAMNYISYTATPYANVLNELGENTLFPRDFIIGLTPGEDYLSASDMFGLVEPETPLSLDIIRTIPEEEKENVIDIHSGINKVLPQTFKTAIDWFVLASCMMRANKHQKPISMLVHTSFKIVDHKIISDVIESYLWECFNNREMYIEKIKELYHLETNLFDNEDFKNGKPEYSNKEAIKDYPTWDQTYHEIMFLLNKNNDKFVFPIELNVEDKERLYHDGIHLVLDNSGNNDNNVRLSYPRSRDKTRKAPLFLVIGGNTLSRGLTLEGLVSTYFIRNTSQADTLYQMGRWFGFRKGYELFPRVWLTNLIIERFTFISQLNTEMRDSIDEMVTLNYSPEKAGLKILNAPNYKFMRVTASNKSQKSIETDIDFSGINSQTTSFENDFNVLKNNIEVTENFLNHIPLSFINKGNMVWEDVPFIHIKNYLLSMNFSDNNPMFRLIDKVIEWYELNCEEYKYNNWNVVFSSKGTIKEADSSDKFVIHGYAPEAIIRSRYGDIRNDGKTVSIKALRSPGDFYADIPNFESSNVQMRHIISKRKEAGHANTPLLIIYRVNKNSQPRSNSKNRYPLNFMEDIIGMNIYIPSGQSDNIKTRYIKIDTSKFDFDNSEDVEEE